MTYRIVFCWLLMGVFFSTSILLSAQDPQNSQSTPSELTIHVVQRGETLYSIALQYNLTLQELADLNGILDMNNIQVGQRLLVPADADPLPEEHIVQAGESLSAIAEQYNLDVNALISYNDISDANRIYVGQVLRLIPDTARTTRADLENLLPTIGSRVHVVQSGETLFKIATSYGLTVNDLISNNSIDDPTQIRAGQQILIPAIAPQVIDIDLPAPFDDLSVRPLIFREGETGSVEITTQQTATVTGTFLDRDLRVIPLNDQTQHIIFVPIPVFTEDGVYPMTLTATPTASAPATINFNVRVAGGGYDVTNLDVSEEMQQLLNPAVQEAELALLADITRNFTPQRYYDQLLSLPAAAAMNAPFGTFRSYNGGPVNTYHSGADFASAPNTPIFAAADGQVVLRDQLNIRGNTVVINHGWGIYTLYAHQTTIEVNVGERVTSGQIIGTAGSTGRVTGPHLHWEVWVNGIPVNPLQWVQYSLP